MDEDFESYVESLKEADGAINLSKHPHLFDCLSFSQKPNPIDLNEIKGIGEMFNYEVVKTPWMKKSSYGY